MHKGWVSTRLVGLALVSGLPVSGWAINDIPPGQTVWLQGVVQQTESGGFRNEGTLRLESIDDAFNVTLVITNGTLTNAASGKVLLHPGAGGSRGLFGDVINEGEILANYYALLGPRSAGFRQRGTFHITKPAGAFFYSGGVFNQEAGSLIVEGRLELAGMQVTYTGGQIIGAPNLINCALRTDPAAAPAHFVINGPNGRLLNDILPGSTITVQGNPRDGVGTLTFTSGLVIAGTLRFDSAPGGVGSKVTVQGGAMTNSAGSSILVLAGGGGAGAIDADLVNLGSMRLQGGLTVTPRTLAMTNAGAISVELDQTLYVNGDYVETQASRLNLALFDVIPFVDDPLVVSNRAVFAGALAVDFPPELAPQLTNEVVLARYQSSAGAFHTAQLPPPPTNNLAWQLHYGTNTLTLSLTNKIQLPTLTNYGVTTNGTFQLRYEGTVGGNYDLQGSTNLVDWTTLIEHRPFSGVSEWIEADALTMTLRCYRLRPAP